MAAGCGTGAGREAGSLVHPKKSVGVYHWCVNLSLVGLLWAPALCGIHDQALARKHWQGKTKSVQAVPSYSLI